MNKMIDGFPTIDDMATDWDAERRYWDLMAAADDYALYLEARMEEEAAEYQEEEDDDPDPPTPAAPTVRCVACQDTGRILKPSAWFAGKMIKGFCPHCTPHYDFARRRFVKPAA